MKHWMETKTDFDPRKVAYEDRLRIFRSTTGPDLDEYLIVRKDVCGNKIELGCFDRADSIFGWTLALIDPYGRPCPENLRALNLDDAGQKPEDPCWTCGNSMQVCDGTKWGEFR